MPVLTGRVPWKVEPGIGVADAAGYVDEETKVQHLTTVGLCIGCSDENGSYEKKNANSVLDAHSRGCIRVSSSIFPFGSRQPA